MDIVLCRRKGSIWAAVLRFVLMSRASHSAVHDATTGWVYDSAFLQRGVRVHDESEFFSKYRETRRIALNIAPARMDDARAWLSDQVGKPYDWRSVFGLLLRQAWNDPDAWQCSEMTEALRARFERPRFRFDASRITPHHQDITL